MTAAAGYLAETRFDLLLVTGDMTQFGRGDEFETARAWLGKLPGPRLATPGNHDTPWAGLLDRVASPFKRYARAIGPVDEDEFTCPGLVARAFNTARGWQLRLDWSKGEITPRQVERAIRDLNLAEPAAVRVLICHHPLIDIPGGPITSRVRGGRRAAARFASAGVDLVLTGHLHAPFVQPFPYGDGLTYAIGAGTLSLRGRGAPPGFNVIDIDGQDLCVTAMAWNGRRLDPYRVWRAPLRGRSARAMPVLDEAIGDV